MTLEYQIHLYIDDVREYQHFYNLNDFDALDRLPAETRKNI